MELFDVLTVTQAKAVLQQHLSKPHMETVPVVKALGKILAVDVLAAEDVPGFDRSTMDGYAVQSKDTFGASESLPAYLDVAGRVQMGKQPQGQLLTGQAWSISTGGMLPAGADGVVMVEYTEELDSQTIGVTRPVAPGENVVRRGEDVAKGSVVLRAGHKIRPQDLGILTATGVTELPVYKTLQVGIISTGDEVVAPEVVPQPGQVRDINSYTLYGLALQSGANAQMYGIVRDDFESLQQTMAKALAENDILLVSGGSSVGTRDVTAGVIAQLGTPGVLFHGINIKPGKPTIGAVVNGKAVFGLPGHPVSAMVVYNLLVDPLIRWAGYDNAGQEIFVRAKITRNMASATGREDFIRVKLSLEQGELLAEPVLGKSGLISTMVKADGVAHIPAGKEGVEAGEYVDVRLF